MSRPRTHEQRLLAPCTELLSRALRETCSSADAAVEILEAVAVARNGWSLDEYRAAFPLTRALSGDVAMLWAEKLLDVLADGSIPLPLALAALGQPNMAPGDQRKAGAYYTDFRLAQHVASQFSARFTAEDRVIDLASGSGMLLAALTLAVSGRDRCAASAFVGNSVCAADLHASALAATRGSLAAIVDDLDALVSLEPRLLHGDSLIRDAREWEHVAPGGFAAVIGNPPWEKLKVTRHEVLTAAGVRRHYGALYESADCDGYDAARREMLAYVDTLVAPNELQGKGEADLYKLFLELGVRLLRPGGEMGLLVPAGLIRAQGTRALREFLVDHAGNLSVTVFENRASFFPIDTRFKFLSLHVRVGEGRRREPVVLRHAEGTNGGVTITGMVKIARAGLRQTREDLTVPEVRSDAEWRLFRQLAEKGTSLAAPEWSHSYRRELDMTNDRDLFGSRRGDDAVPLVEGRMVHQHRVMAKAHVEGTGRAAVWEPLALGSARLRPQFWVGEAALPEALRRRVEGVRAGFCDVTGQTNERTLLAAVIPSGVVCGNKVPTLTFRVPGLDPARAALAWVAVANSLPVDWAARRVVTTSMNYFLLRSLPLPRLDDGELERVASHAAFLRDAEAAGASSWRVAEVRADIDAVVAAGFGLNVADLELMLRDFKLLDRGQPPLAGEDRSSVTRDLVLATLARRLEEDCRSWVERVGRARELGAVPYVPADYSAIIRP